MGVCVCRVLWRRDGVNENRGRIILCPYSWEEMQWALAIAIARESNIPVGGGVANFVLMATQSCFAIEFPLALWEVLLVRIFREYTISACRDDFIYNLYVLLASKLNCNERTLCVERSPDKIVKFLIFWLCVGNNCLKMYRKQMVYYGNRLFNTRDKILKRIVSFATMVVEQKLDMLLSQYLSMLTIV